MEINRNQYLMAGLILLFVGLQFRFVDTYVLNREATDFVVEKWKQQKEQSDQPADRVTALMARSPLVQKQPLQSFQPPPWLGWSLLSVGGVLILHSLAMKRPG